MHAAKKSFLAASPFYIFSFPLPLENLSSVITSMLEIFSNIFDSQAHLASTCASNIQTTDVGGFGQSSPLWITIAHTH